MSENDKHKGLEMTPGEILTSYKQAKKKAEQIKILAQLNATTPEKIRDIICEASGGEYNKRTFNRSLYKLKQQEAREPLQQIEYKKTETFTPEEFAEIAKAAEKETKAIIDKNPETFDDTKRPDDQTIKADAGKPKLSLVPPQIIRDIARVREYGVKKYGKTESWRSVSIDRYRDALFRHLLDYLSEPGGNDAESGLPHLSHIACNVAFLCELEKGNTVENTKEAYRITCKNCEYGKTVNLKSGDTIIHCILHDSDVAETDFCLDANEKTNDNPDA